ncbi:MAG: hypothetical protein EXS43_05895, partial [Opitutus sp.]|nr:hypothetical protein [Opitutus sp.]
MALLSAFARVSRTCLPLIFCRTTFALFAASAFVTRPVRAAEPVLRAGADRSDITPELGTVLPGSFTAEVTGIRVHDPLHVR